MVDKKGKQSNTNEEFYINDQQFQLLDHAFSCQVNIY